MDTDTKKIDTKKCEDCKKRNCIKCALSIISADDFRLRVYNQIADIRSYMNMSCMNGNTITKFNENYYNKIVKLSRKSDKNYGWCVYSRDGMSLGFTNGEIMIPTKGVVQLSDTWRKVVFDFLKRNVRYDFSYLTEDELVNSDPASLIPNGSILKKVYGKKTKVENELMFLCELVIFIEGYYIHLERCINRAIEVLDGKKDPKVSTKKPYTSISKPLIDIVPYRCVGNACGW